MEDYAARGRAIVMRTLAKHKRFITEIAGSAHAGIKRLRFQLSSGTQVSLSFNNVATLYPRAAGLEVEECDARSWNELEVSYGNKVWAHLCFSGSQVQLLSYVPGNWERDFGMEPRHGDPILLPPALRQSA